MNKTDSVLMHLKKQPITSWEAITLYRATRLADIIYRLKEKGYNILTVMVQTEDSVYARYFLQKAK